MARLAAILAIAALLIAAPLHHAAAAAGLPAPVLTDICGDEAEDERTCEACGQKAVEPGARFGTVRVVAHGRTAVGRGRHGMPRRRRRAHGPRAPPA